MLSVVIEAYQKVGYVPLHLLQINCLAYGDWAFEVTLHSSSAWLDGIYPVQIQRSCDVKQQQGQIWGWAKGGLFSLKLFCIIFIEFSEQ